MRASLVPCTGGTSDKPQEFNPRSRRRPTRHISPLHRCTSPALRSLEKGKSIGIQRGLPRGRMAISSPPRADAAIGSVDGTGSKNGDVYVAPHLTAIEFTSSSTRTCSSVCCSCGWALTLISPVHTTVGYDATKMRPWLSKCALRTAATIQLPHRESS